MANVAQLQFDPIPGLLGAPVGDLEDLAPGQVALAGYFCDNLNRPSAGQRYLARQLRYVSRSGEETLNALDLGDVNVFPLEPDKHFAAVITQCRAVLGTGARMVLVGGDPSGAEALWSAARQVKGEPVLKVAATGSADPTDTSLVVLYVDLQELAGNWLSQPRHLTGLTPAELITRIETMRGNVIAAAIFGLAPALDSCGTTETHAALAILRAVMDRLGKGAA